MILILLFVVSACTPVADKGLQEELDAKNQIITRLEDENRKLEDKVAKLEQNDNNSSSRTIRLTNTALKTVELLKNKNMKTVFSVSDFTDHPQAIALADLSP